jgi:3-oxoacyl-[acyl-carrier protein] reductase
VHVSSRHRQVGWRPEANEGSSSATALVRSIVITGASKGIGRAAAHALVEDGWPVIGVARSLPTNFPGVLIEADLTDREKTQDFADDLIARGNVVGIVNNVGLARHERVDAVDPGVFAMVMDLNVRPATLRRNRPAARRTVE